MAGTGRRAARTVEERLEAEPYGFDFYRAVSLLESLRPNATPVGEGSDPKREPVRFRGNMGLGFPASALGGLEPSHNGEPPTLTVNFLSAGGALGPLPRTFTELTLERTARRDTALRDFLDIFHHRLASLMYRVREKFRPGLAPRAPERTRFAQYLYALLGLGTTGLRGRLGIPDQALLPYVGLLSQRPRSAVGLQRLLACYFGVPVAIAQFRGRWFPLAADQHTILGVRGQNCALGDNAVAGQRIWEQQALIEIEIGPLDAPTFRRFLPSGDALGPLTELARFYLGREIDFTVRLSLSAGERPASTLRPTPTHEGPRLGWTAWLQTQAAVGDDRQVVLGSAT